MKKAISFLQDSSRGRTVLILFIVTNVFYVAILGYSIPLVLSFAPESVLFDLSPTGYSYDEAIILLRTLGLEGRDAYLAVQIPIDLVYPGLFAISYALLITWVLKQFLPRQSRLFFFAFVPVFAGIFDYLENATIVAMLNGFPDISEVLVTSASSFTIAKSGFTTLFFVGLLVALVYWAIWRLRKGRQVAKSRG